MRIPQATAACGGAGASTSSPGLSRTIGTRQYPYPVRYVEPTGAVEAVEAVTTASGPPPETGKYVAYPDDNSLLTLVVTEDAQGRGFPHVWVGGGWLVGPDAKVFPLSSNYSIHNGDLARDLLSRLYRDGLMAHVEPQEFVDRLERLTKEQAGLANQVAAEAEEGQLRPRPRRILP